MDFTVRGLARRLRLAIGIRNALKSMAVIAVGASSFYTFYAIEPDGYCSSQQRSLSDEEFVNEGLRIEARDGNLKLLGRYATPGEFHAMHPQCCFVDRTPNSVLARRFGVNMVGVNLFYDADEKTAYKVHMEIKACGKVMRRQSIEVTKDVVPVLLSY